jgi:hypothetical protein
MITFEKAVQKSMTRPSLSVHHTSFLWALLQELVRSIIHRFVPRRGASLQFSEITSTKPRLTRSSLVMFES